MRILIIDPHRRLPYGHRIRKKKGKIGNLRKRSGAMAMSLERHGDPNSRRQEEQKQKSGGFSSRVEALHSSDNLLYANFLNIRI